ncbi:MAG TPA: hypothetical protein VGC03_02265 [Acidimicrobiia bacterium]|jgi:hypothetical protein
MLDKLARRGLSLSILVGTLLVPLTALAAIWLTDPERGEEPSIPTTNAIPATTLTTQSTSEATVDITADLQAACGLEGMQLVSLEESLTITDVQQAALDALRGVCEQQGIPLPSKPALEPIVQTVVVPATATAGPVPSSTPTTFHDEDEDEYEDEHEDEYEDEDESDD